MTLSWMRNANLKAMCDQRGVKNSKEINVLCAVCMLIVYSNEYKVLNRWLIQVTLANDTPRTISFTQTQLMN